MWWSRFRAELSFFKVSRSSIKEITPIEMTAGYENILPLHAVLFFKQFCFEYVKYIFIE